MVDKTSLERQALAATLSLMAEIAAEVGVHKPLGRYTQEEALTLAEAVVGAYQDYILSSPSPTKGI